MNRVDFDVGLPLATIRLNLESNATDFGPVPPAAHAELGQKYGVRKASPGQYFVNPSAAFRYVAMNHDRPLFGGSGLGNVGLKKAVNNAIDRIAMINQRGAYAGVINDQYMPPTMRGFKNAAIYPSRPNVARARSLAQGNTPRRQGRALHVQHGPVRPDRRDRAEQPEGDRSRHGDQAVPACRAVHQDRDSRRALRHEPRGLAHGLLRPVRLHVPARRDDDPRGQQQQLLVLQQPAVQPQDRGRGVPRGSGAVPRVREPRCRPGEERSAAGVVHHRQHPAPRLEVDGLLLLPAGLRAGHRSRSARSSVFPVQG